MKTQLIKNFLPQIDVDVDSIVKGDYDYIAEFTAKRQRSPTEENYHKVGCFFKPNLERGILVYELIRRFNMTSFLEIGTGRGYVTFCAAKAFHDAGVKGKVVTIDPNLNEGFLNQLQQVLPKEWFSYVQFVRGTSREAMNQVDGTYDLIYIDGDHSVEGTLLDWNLTKERFNKAILFDDYHLPSKNDPGIQCRTAIDSIDFDSENCDEPTLIIGDRRIFFDDRRLSDEHVDYGQVLAFRKGVQISGNDW